MDRWDWTVLGVLVGFALILMGMWLWRRRQVNKIEVIENDPARSRKLVLEQYVRDLERGINDVSFKVKELDDPDQRKSWKSYEQELRKRQLMVIQEIQDKEWRKLRGGSLTREEMREVERVALREMRRLEERYFNPEDIRKFSMEGRY